MITEIRNEVKVLLDGKTVVTLPAELREIAESIEKSKYILALEKDFDGENSEPYAETAWLKSVRFVAEYAQWLFDVFGKTMATPKIYHAPKGSIDIYWENERFNLLINVPPGNAPTTFYGDNYGAQSTEGKFDPQHFQQALLPDLSLLSRTNVAR